MTTVILQCPLCRNPLLNAPGGYQCLQNHTFDSARQGYVNLLLAHKKNSKEPGDGKDMIKSRRRFLDLGLYDAISDGINDAVGAHLSSAKFDHVFNILDVGCGEGFYLKRLKEFLIQTSPPVPVDYFGVDISKFAVRKATQRDRTMNWFVASVNDIPFSSGAMDAVLNVFSPANYSEFSRVLRAPGRLLIVTPGPKHLYGLRKIIYPNVREHAPSTVNQEASPLFSIENETRINYPIELKSSEMIMDLLAMTPYYWNVDFKTKSRVVSLSELALDVDVEIRVFKKN
jgi:23S rRNA (guanine745-N1)-methyltransferase